MHAIHHDPRRVLLAALAAFILAVSTFAAPRALDDLSRGGSGPSADAAPPATAPASRPTWAVEPLASPIAELRTVPRR